MKINGPDAKTSVCLLMVNCAAVAFPSLELHDFFHFPFCVLDDSGSNGDVRGVDKWASSECVLARPDLVNGVECQNVTDLDIVHAWNGQEVAWCKNVFFSRNSGHNIVRWLRTNELQRGGGRLWRM